MNVAKTVYKKLGKWLVFSFLLAFPFGQLISFDFSFYGYSPNLHLIDLIAGASFILAICAGLKRPSIFSHFKNFFVLALFSLFLSVFYFPLSEVAFGSFYFIRLIFWGYFFVLVWNLLKDGLIDKGTLIKSLIAVSVTSAIYGWIQYIFIPDLRSLFYIGWDDHYYRLAGTFLDPGFMGIVAVFGFLASFAYFLESKKKSYLLLSLFLLLTLAFTYSRASYLALITGSVYLIFKANKIRKAYLFVIAFLMLLPFLPRPAGEGVRLERVHSIYAKAGNYSQTIKIIKNYPLLGVGYNNICSVRIRMFNDEFDSHSCAGSDSSLLLVLATTGTVGFLAFIKLIYEVWAQSKRKFYGSLFLISLVAVLTHSLFVNSLFYPWVLGWLLVLLPTAVGES